MEQLIDINRVDGNTEPKPKGEIATRKMIPPKIPNRKVTLFISVVLGLLHNQSFILAKATL